MKTTNYDLVAIGGGTAGLVSVAGASYLGARAGLLERERLGGDCLWTGCIPSKALIASAQLAHAMRHAEALGLKGAAPAHAFSEVLARMRRARDVVARHDDPDRFRRLGAGVHFGTARFLGPGELEVEGVGRVRSRRIVLATGATPSVPPIPGLKEAGYLTYETAFEAESLPEALVILGGGTIGLEFAQVYRRLGAEVTVVEMLPRILHKEDAEVSEALRGFLEEEGIRFRTGVKGAEVRREGKLKVVSLENGDEVRGTEIFLATGRCPQTRGLELERAGVQLRGSGVWVDERLRTTARGVWAAGDVAGGPQYTHVAEYMAKMVLRNALLPFGRRVDFSMVPRVTYTDPEVAHVGLSRDEGEARGGSTYSYPFAELDRAVVEEKTKGFATVTVNRRGRILGATILGAGAGELLMPVVLAHRNRIPLSKISGTVFPYPTRAEGLKRLADAYQRARLQGTGGRILRKVVSWLA